MQLHLLSRVIRTSSEQDVRSSEIDLPGEGWTPLDAEIVTIRPEYGYGVQFVDMQDATCRRLERVIERIAALNPQEG